MPKNTGAQQGRGGAQASAWPGPSSQTSSSMWVPGRMARDGPVQMRGEGAGKGLIETASHADAQA